MPLTDGEKRASTRLILDEIVGTANFALPGRCKNVVAMVDCVAIPTSGPRRAVEAGRRGRPVVPVTSDLLFSG